MDLIANEARVRDPIAYFMITDDSP